MSSTSSLSAKSQSRFGTVEVLEKRQMMAFSPAVFQQLKVALPPDTDGTPSNTNRLQVRFDRTVRVGDLTKMRLFGYGFALPGNGQKKVTINITQAFRAPDDPNTLTLITDRLVRKGARLFIYQGALTDSQGRDIVADEVNKPQLVLPKGQNKYRFTLANRAWRPTDFTFFNKETYSAAPNPTVANGNIDVTTARQNLATFLNSKRVQGKILQGQVDVSLQRFDNAQIAARVPNPNLRAALLSLIGTVGEPAIGSFLDGENRTGVPHTIVDFSDEVSSGAVVAETKLTTGGRLRTLVKTQFRSEPFQSLSAILAHEAIHQDTPNTQEEEIIANAIETTVLTQQYTIDPSVASRGTQLVTKQNQRLLAMLNSGDTLFPYGGIKTAPVLTPSKAVFQNGNGTLITGSPITSFEDWVRREYIARGYESGSTTGNITLTAIMKNIVGTRPNVNFNSTTIGTFDNSNTAIIDITSIRMAQLLKLTYGE